MAHQSTQTAHDPPEATAPRSLGERVRFGFRALRVRNYRLYWWGQVVSLTGTWMQTTAQAWLVYEITGRPLSLGIVTTLQFLPVTLFSLWGGVLADRVPKRRLLIWTQVAALLIAIVFGLLAATEALQLWHIYGIAWLTGMVNAFDNPARQSFAAELVGREEVGNAVALNSMMFNTARIIGPAVAGGMIALVGAAPALFFNAASFGAGIAALVLMNPAQMFGGRAAPKGQPSATLRDSLRYIARTPPVLLVMIVMALVGTFGYNFSITLPLLAGFVLKTEAVGFGLLPAAMGVGSLGAAFFAAFAPRITARRMLLGAGGFSLVFFAVAQSRSLPLTLALLVVQGFCGITFAISANTLVQTQVRDDMRGRVMGLYMLLFAGSTPIGALFIGGLSDWWGVPLTLSVCAAMCILGVALGVTYERKGRGTGNADDADDAG